VREGPGRWSWKAPASGLRRLTIRRPAGDSITLNAFVLVPAARVRAGRLNGYRIGAYPSKPLKGLAIYRPPKGFVEVTPENENTPLSPHFTLGQFLCKQEGGYPKYIVLRTQLLLKLEYLLGLVNSEGFRADTFTVMSGYRTPDYNRAIGNVPYSRHVYGGAADIYIDENPRDGVMDDLDGNGHVDKADAAVLYDLIAEQSSRPEYDGHEGGLGEYGSTPAHGPFVHVDVRGFSARWGK